MVLNPKDGNLGKESLLKYYGVKTERRVTFNFKVFIRNENIFKKYTNQPCLFSKRRFYCIIQSKLRSDWTFIGDMQKKQRPQPEVAGLSSFEAGTER